jgi:serine/threonine-protein kinase
MDEAQEKLATALQGRYRIEREIGRGGAAIVYLARDCKHDRQVAVKVLRPDLSYSVGGERFLREIRIAAQLSHPHILGVHDSGDADGFLHYVMPFVEGESLRDRLDREGRLGVAETVRLLHDVLDGMQYAHQRGVVHRDIKPGNVMVTGRHAVVADFGVAKAVRSARGEGDLDSLGVVLGTPTYMAPEQASADPGIDQRADIYAVGVLAYEMLTGAPPFRGSSPQQILAAHVTAKPQPLAEVRPDVPEPLADWVMACLEKDPRDRWQSAEAMLQYLDRYAYLTEDSGDPTVPVTPVARPRRRARATVAGVAAVFVALVLGVLLRSPPEAAAAGRPVLVVLPFENLGAVDDDFFAAGITDAITVRLASLGNLAVISRSSAKQYASGSHSTRQIADDLGVDYLLEGTVQRERPGDTTSRVRVIPQLVRVSDDTHVWAEVFDEDLTEVFQVQSTIAERVARALDVALLEPERRRLAARYTESVEAYELYLRGHDYLAENLATGDANARRVAIGLFERAIALDGSFALAWAELSLAHMWLYRHFVDRSPARRAMASAAVDSALALDPDLPTVHLARGLLYYWGPEPAPDSALQEFEHVAAREPNNAYARTLIASLLAARGEWDRALENAQLAVDLDPLEPEWAAAAGRLHLLSRRYDAADRLLARAVSLAPDHPQAQRDRLALALRRDGDLEAARTVVRSMQDVLTSGSVALAIVSVAPELVVDGSYDVLFDDLIPASISGPLPLDYLWVKSEFAWLRGRNAEARAYADSLLTAADGLDDARGEDPSVLTIAARALATLGRAEDALTHAAVLESLLRAEGTQAEAAAVHEALVRVYGLTGDVDAAMDHVDALLAMPSLASVPYLRIAHLPEGVRAHPRFVTLLSRVPAEVPVG